MYLPYWIENDSKRYSKALFVMSLLLFVVGTLTAQVDAGRAFSARQFDGDLFRLHYFLSPFVHFNWQHALSNALQLFLFGTFVRLQYGFRFLWGIIIPITVFTPVLQSFFGTDAIGFSASTAALTGFVLATAPERNVRITTVLILQNGVLKVAVTWLILASVIYDIVGFLCQLYGLSDGIAHGAHLLGFAYGFALARLAQTGKLRFAVSLPAKQFTQLLPSFFKVMQENHWRILTRVIGITVIVFAVYQALRGHFMLPDLPPEYQNTFFSLFVVYGITGMCAAAGLSAMLGFRYYGLIYITVALVGLTFNIYYGRLFSSNVGAVLLAIAASQYSTFDNFRLRKKSAPQPNPTPEFADKATASSVEN